VVKKPNESVFFINTLKAMFGIFKKKSKAQKLQSKYESLLKEAFQISHKNRAASDAKVAEAQEVLKELEALDKK
jgi:hypothetical protein